MVRQVQAMLDFHHQGIPTLDYGNNIRQMAKEEGLQGAFEFPGFVPAYIRPLFCRGIGPSAGPPFSGDPEDIYRTDAKALIPNDKHLHHWLDMARERIYFRGPPTPASAGSASACATSSASPSTTWSGPASSRPQSSSAATTSIPAPSPAPTARPKAMQDGTGAVSGWPLCAAQLRLRHPPGSPLHHGGGVGMGFSQHAGMVIVSPTAQAAARRTASSERVERPRHRCPLMRHADAGYVSSNARRSRA
ncbi:MAG: hypothetical protein R3C69_06840 [Geminicoccaceae bacterium]